MHPEECYVRGNSIKYLRLPDEATASTASALRTYLNEQKIYDICILYDMLLCICMCIYIECFMHLFRFLFYLFIYVCMWAIVCTCVSMYACTEAYACAIVLYRSMNHMHTYIHIQNIHTVHVCRHVCMCILHNYTNGSISLCACVCTEAYTQRGGEGERERERSFSFVHACGPASDSSSDMPVLVSFEHLQLPTRHLSDRSSIW